MNAQELILPAERAERARAYLAPAIQPGNDSSAIMQIIERAMREPSFDIDKIQQMLALKERWDANEARKAFTADMAEFKKDPPLIYKNKHVGFKAKNSDSRTDYDHATHSEVTMKIIAGLAKHGFSHRWVPTQPDGNVRVTCTITHRLGHSESLEMTAPPDTSGNKSPVQAVASTKTLLERYTLLAATGLSAADLPDADDKDGSDERPPLHEDVKIALKEASKEGTDALARCFKSLSETTRARIVADYNEEWTALKEDAAKVVAQ